MAERKGAPERKPPQRQTSGQRPGQRPTTKKASAANEKKKPFLLRLLGKLLLIALILGIAGILGSPGILPDAPKMPAIPELPDFPEVPHISDLFKGKKDASKETTSKEEDGGKKAEPAQDADPAAAPLPEKIKAGGEDYPLTQSIADEANRGALLSKSRTPSLGNNSKVGSLVSLLPQPDPLLTYDGIALETKEDPFVLHIYYALPKDKAHADLSKKSADVFFSNAVYLFATVENMDKCEFHMTNAEGDSVVKYSRSDLEKLFEGPLFPYSETPESLAALDTKVDAYLEFLGLAKTY